MLLLGAKCTSGTAAFTSSFCCPAETEDADEAYCIIQSQYTDTGPTSRIADPIYNARRLVGWFLEDQCLSLIRLNQGKQESIRGSPVLEAAVVVCWLLNVPASSLCISGKDLLR